MVTESDLKNEKIAVERNRIVEEYSRRESQLDPNLYAPWQPAESMMLAERKRIAAQMLKHSDGFPTCDDECLEIGYGRIGWLGDLISWGVRSERIHGIELDKKRAETAISALPAADLRIGDASELPWEDAKFKLVIVSTVFSSILDEQVQSLISKEISRVLAVGGHLLWYDIAVNNPGNQHIRKIPKRQIKSLFPKLQGSYQSLTLAPPIARRVAPVSWIAASLLGALPILRTHLLAVMRKRPNRELDSSI